MKYLVAGRLIRKSLEIIRCRQCHYMEQNGSHIVCINVDSDLPKEIPYPMGIPYWCPLEDWPEE